MTKKIQKLKEINLILKELLLELETKLFIENANNSNANAGVIK